MKSRVILQMCFSLTVKTLVRSENGGLALSIILAIKANRSAQIVLRNQAGINTIFD